MTDPEIQLSKTSSGSKIKLTSSVKAGGCAAKISSAELRQIVCGLPRFDNPNLLTTIESFEDATVYKLSEDTALVQTVDFFPPVVDDPFLFGEIAAVNALSDIYAMGGTPTFALSILGFPTCDYPLSVANAIVAGGASALKRAGAALAGGHSIQTKEPIYGLAVTGFVNTKQILTNGGAKDGDALVITKPIGTGTLLLAYKGEEITEETKQILIHNLTLLNSQALSIGRSFSINAATDVTGFGLIGHAHEMAKASGLACKLFCSQIPFLPEAQERAAEGFVNAAAYANRNSFQEIAHIKDDLPLSTIDLLFDPQTSGGLLFSLPANEADALVDSLKATSLTAAKIGSMYSGDEGIVEVMH